MEIDKQSGQSGELGSVYWAEPKGRSVGRSGRSGGGVCWGALPTTLGLGC